MPDPHGEHSRCARCEAVGRAEAEARVAALTAELRGASDEIDWQVKRGKALTAALEAIAEKADNYLAAAILPVRVGIHLQGLTHGLEEIRHAALDAAGGAP